MHSEFEMSMMGELNFFLGLQIKQLKEGTFINQAKYIRDLLKRFNMEEAKTIKTPMSSSIKLDMDEKGFGVDFGTHSSFISVRLGLRVGVALSCLISFSFWTSLSPYSIRWMAPRQETDTSRAQGKRPAEPSQPEQTEAHQKASRMGWLPVVTIFEPIFPTLVRVFYSLVTYGLGGPIMSTIREVEIGLSLESICRIFSTFLQLASGYAQGMGKPLAHSLIVPSQVLHHMICSILLPRGGDRDEVSYLEAFIVDSILTGRRIHGRLEQRDGLEAPTSYDTYDEQSLGRMKFEKAPDGSWIRRAERQARGPSSQPSFIELPHTELPSQAPHAPDHAPWMDVSAQISSLGTRMEEFALVHDTRFYSMEEHIDQYQIGFTSRFEHFQQRFERIEERMDQQ
ncbi:hypothetical protein CK203_027687 [Vitis vinifera]|uniref:Reverse transcriptase Ty1/copia-type domain-containing protein n=1 Tax=Vitis vinifera TaxID=29760 RepID=A0A438IGW6_VITVI|nr:hypothetical protein CK203_027687 [Vitis vinifera]